MDGKRTVTGDGRHPEKARFIGEEIEVELYYDRAPKGVYRRLGAWFLTRELLRP
ncbi:MAG: hypothetical protein ACE5E7_01600 [Anaerolineae bacterium]